MPCHRAIENLQLCLALSRPLLYATYSSIKQANNLPVIIFGHLSGNFALLYNSSSILVYSLCTFVLAVDAYVCMKWLCTALSLVVTGNICINVNWILTSELKITV